MADHSTQRRPAPAPAPTAKDVAPDATKPRPASRASAERVGVEPVPTVRDYDNRDSAMRQVRCPHCGRTLFWSNLPWTSCSATEALISIRCTRKWRCGLIVKMRILAVPRTTFEHPDTRTNTIASLKDAIELPALEMPGSIPCSRLPS